MKIVSVKFSTDSRTVDYVDSEDIYEVSDVLIIDSSQIKETGKVVDKYTLKKGEKYKNETDKGKIVGKVTKNDEKKIKENKRKALDYILICKEKIAEHDLAMDVMDADLSFDEKKLTIYFTANKRVDFRSLVSDYVRSFKKLVRLQQVGLREQIKMMDWIGKCGQKICCARFLDCPKLVTTDYARRQNLGETNNNKINGVCGKLMCCLKYEDEVYTEAKKGMPKIGDRIKTKQGVGKVIKQNVLYKKVIVLLDNKEKVEVSV